MSWQLELESERRDEDWHLKRPDYVRFDPLQPRDSHGRWAKLGIAATMAIEIANMFNPKPPDDNISPGPPLGQALALGQAAIPRTVETPMHLGRFKELSKKPVARMTDKQLIKFLHRLRQDPWSSWHAEMIQHARAELWRRGYATDMPGDIPAPGSHTHKPADRLVVIPPGTLTHHAAAKPKVKRVRSWEMV